MANRARGEVAVSTFDGVEYTAAPYFNGLSSVTTQLGCANIQAVFQRIADTEPLAVKAYVWVLLQRYHSAEIVTIDDAGLWIDRIGGVDGAQALILRSMEANRDAAAGPLTAQTGTGERSSSELVAPA